MNEEGIKKLAKLSRLELTEAEVSAYAGEFSGILSYIDTLKEAVDSSEDIILENSMSRNVMREDENPHESGINTVKIVEAAPDSENNFIKVRKVL